MKTSEYIKTLRAKKGPDLAAELEALRKEQFSLRMQKATGQEHKSHLTSQVRKKIAQLKTVMRSQVNAS